MSCTESWNKESPRHCPVRACNPQSDLPTNLRGLQAALADIVPAKDPLVARDPVDGVLPRVEELGLLLTHRHAVRSGATHDDDDNPRGTDLQLDELARLLYTCFTINGLEVHP